MANPKGGGRRRSRPRGIDFAALVRWLATATRTDLAPGFLDIVMPVFGFDAAVLYYINRRNARYEVVTTRGDVEALPCIVEGLPLDQDSLTARVARSGEPWFADDLQAGPFVTEGACDLCSAQGFRSSAILPLTVEGETVGVLCLAARAPRVVDAAGRTDLTVAVAQLRDSLIARKLPQANREAENRIRAIGNSTLAISAEFAVESVLQTIVDQARAVAGARYAALGIGTDPHRQFHPWVYSGMGADIAKRIGRYPRPVGMLGAAVAEGRPLRMPDLSADERSIGFPPGHPDMKSFLGMPIRYRGESIGHLYLTEKVDADEFTEDDVDAVEILAAQAAIAFEHAQLYERVEDERRRLNAVLVSSPLAILFIEKATQLIYANPTAQDFFGIAENETGGESYLGRIGRIDGEALTMEELPSNRALNGETILGFDVIVHRPDGRDVPSLINAAPVSDAQGAVIGAVVIFQNLEPLKLERLREEFISVIAHDLRAPITVISGFAEILERIADERVAPERERKAIESILSSARRLTRMVGDLLDISRIEARRLRLERRQIDLGDLAGDIVGRAKTLVGDHPIAYVAPSERLPVSADASRIEQVLTNLLTNAAKYSPSEAPVEVSVSRRGDDAVVSVADRGAGIPEEEQSKLFTRFYRTRDVGDVKGLGLGLYISKGIVEAHEGRIWVESRAGGGSVFSFALPIKPADPTNEETGTTDEHG